MTPTAFDCFIMANKRVQFGYGLNYLIDIENAVIVDVEATPARTYDEVAANRGFPISHEQQAFPGLIRGVRSLARVKIAQRRFWRLRHPKSVSRRAR
jgi:hypothetical protein